LRECDLLAGTWFQVLKQYIFAGIRNTLERS
jgi:hypothetical protein